MTSFRRIQALSGLLGDRFWAAGDVLVAVPRVSSRAAWRRRITSINTSINISINTSMVVDQSCSSQCLSCVSCVYDGVCSHLTDILSSSESQMASSSSSLWLKAACCSVA